MNGLRFMRLFHSSEIQLFQTVCFTITWKQTNKDYKEELVSVLYFLNITSALGRKVVLIPDYLHSPFHIFAFYHVVLEVLRRTSSSKNECAICLELFQNYYQLKM